jgi:prophage DNA circulation protein
VETIREALEEFAPNDDLANALARKFGLTESHHKRDALAALDALEAELARKTEALRMIEKTTRHRLSREQAATALSAVQENDHHEGDRARAEAHRRWEQETVQENETR